MLSAVATWGNLLRQAAEAGLKLLTQQVRGDGRTSERPRRPAAPPRPAPSAPSRTRTTPTRDRARRIAYAPDLDGAADPGEVVWAWVPYEEGDGRGKDRPVLVVGRQGRELVGLMLSSRHDRADDRDWLEVGTGAWDAQGRPSYVRLDRVIEVGEHDIRREGAVLDEARFDRVADALRSRYGWS
jgi:PemK-like, MazF-like toxin of type II toxin-antitoxin system